MSTRKSDITKYSPSLGEKAQKYNEVILKTLALKGPKTSFGISGEILDLIIKHKFKTKKIKRSDLNTVADRYYKKKKLNVVVDRRLYKLQENPEEPKYVKAIKKQKGKKSYNEWNLTFRGYILSLVTFPEVQKEWRSVFQLWKSVMPEYAQGLTEFMIKHKVTNNAHYLFVVESLKYALKNGKLDVIDSDEITREANYELTLALDELLSLLISKKHKVNNLHEKEIPAIFRKFRKLKKEDLTSIFRLFSDPNFKREFAKETENLLAVEREKISYLEKMTERLRGLG